MDGLPLSRRSRRVAYCYTVLASFLLCCLSGSAWAIPANPEPFWDLQGDGTQVRLRARGDERLHWLEDERGYTVVRANGWLYYAERGPNGTLRAGPWRVGIDSPSAQGLQKHLLPGRSERALTSPVFATNDSGGSAAIAPEAVATSGALKNLTVLIRFADDAGLPLPSNSDYDVLFNADGGHPTLAPTGSLKDVYREVSYDQLTINSTVSGWHTVSHDESYYTADGENGSSPLGQQAMREALDLADQFIDFNQFDEDGDGYVDSLAFVHSGYGAEWGANPTRFWSHRWVLVQQIGNSYYYNDWVSDEGVRVRDYHISTGLWGTSGYDIGHIGVIAHETGHYLGLPDLYDPNGGGSGIGSWGLMANSWGFDGTQYCPGHMSPWSKQFLGWMSPTVLTANGLYVANQSETTPQAYRINAGYPSGEYLMIENRQAVGIDCSVPQGGLLVWHIDETATDTAQGYPGQAGWPGNGNHYRVALLQADGNYNLERGNNRGDSGDPHHAAGVDAIGPYSVSGYPNTDAYQDGNVFETGHLLTDISASGTSMSFCLGTCAQALPAPSGLVANATGSDSIAVTWSDNSSGEDGFRLEHSTNGSSWSLEANLGANVTAYNDSGLAAASLHYYRVRAFQGADNSAWSNTGSATTNDIPPAAPTGLLATGVSESRIDLAWSDNANNENNYRVDVSSDGLAWTTLATLGANSTAYSHTGLPSNATRHYQVFAVNGVGSAGSNTASASTLPPPPQVDYAADSEFTGGGSVSGTYVATLSDDGVEQRLTEIESGGKPSNRHSYLEHTWHFSIGSGSQVSVEARARRANNTDGDDFTFAWSDDNVTFTDLFIVNAAGEASYQGSVPNSVSGDLWIRVTDTDDTAGKRSLDSVWVDQLFVRVFNDGPPTAPSAPSALGASAAGADSINLAWTDASSNESGFRIERSGDGASGWSQVGSVGQNVESWSDSGLAESTEYFYRVFAWNGVGDSTASNVASATTEAAPPPGSITLSVNGFKNKGKKNYTLTWSGAAGASVDVYRDGVFRFTTPNDGSESYDSGETGGGTHTHVVCEAGTSTCSDPVDTVF